jgi:hypothetical protein
MRNDSSRDAGCGGDLVKRSAQLVTERLASTWASEEKLVSGTCILGAKHLETTHDPADEGVDRNEALRP